MTSRNSFTPQLHITPLFIALCVYLLCTDPHLIKHSSFFQFLFSSFPVGIFCAVKMKLNKGSVLLQEIRYAD